MAVKVNLLPKLDRDKYELGQTIFTTNAHFQDIKYSVPLWWEPPCMQPLVAEHDDFWFNKFLTQNGISSEIPTEW